MRHSLSKACGVAFLSFVILYSGVAWAVTSCFGHADHVNHAAALAEGHYHQAHSVSYHVDQYPKPPNLHCFDYRYRIGPIADLSPKPKLTSFTDGVLLKAPLSTETVASSEIEDFWLRAFLDRLLSPFSLSGGLSRHLFLSVFQI
ncbi:MAG: hypothetical protein ACE5HC_08565 [Candidatus Binatia bacterium]